MQRNWQIDLCIIKIINKYHIIYFSNPFIYLTGMGLIGSPLGNGYKAIARILNFKKILLDPDLWAWVYFAVAIGNLSVEDMYKYI